MGRREEDLTPGMAQHLEKPTVSGTVELARNIVQEKDGYPSGSFCQEVELGGLESQHDRAVLTL